MEDPRQDTQAAHILYDWPQFHNIDLIMVYEYKVKLTRQPLI